MDISVLLDQNPWWKGKERIEDDYDIKRWREKEYTWEPKILDEIDIKPFAFHIILGPRQVGKTTAVKLFIRKLLEKQAPESLFYFSCEEIGDFKELLDVIQSYTNFKNASDVKKSIIVLDEITSVKDWYKAIKSLIDKGKLNNDILIVTGSISLNIKKDIELFPGRRGKGKDFVLLPLSFREYLKIMKPDIWGKIQPTKKISELEKSATKAMVYFDEINKEFLKYMNSGGFPTGIELADVDRERAKKVYLSWIKNAILKSGKSDLVGREILKNILEKTPNPMSWESISKEIEVKSPKTVSAYVEMFKNIFSLLVFYNVDVRGKIKFGKNKKIHILDPLLFEIFEDWCLLSIKNKNSVLVESIVAVHLNRLFPEKTFFWKNGFEIDVIIVDKKELSGFEVKFTDKQKIVKTLPQIKNFVVVSKKHFSKKPLTIPVSVFLSILDVEH